MATVTVHDEIYPLIRLALDYSEKALRAILERGGEGLTAQEKLHHDNDESKIDCPADCLWCRTEIAFGAVVVVRFKKAELQAGIKPELCCKDAQKAADTTGVFVPCNDCGNTHEPAPCSQVDDLIDEGIGTLDAKRKK